jgi:hypothetical protein
MLLACGGSSGAKVSDQNKTLAAYQDCMARHGAPAPGSSNTQADQATVQRAGDACKSLQPKIGKPSPPSQAQQQQLLKFTACMREHGINMPDPKAAGNPETGVQGGNQSATGGLNPQSPQFQAAAKACNHLLGNGNNRIQTGPTASSGS